MQISVSLRPAWSTRASFRTARIVTWRNPVLKTNKQTKRWESLTPALVTLMGDLVRNVLKTSLSTNTNNSNQTILDRINAHVYLMQRFQVAGEGSVLGRHFQR